MDYDDICTEPRWPDNAQPTNQTIGSLKFDDALFVFAGVAGAELKVPPIVPRRHESGRHPEPPICVCDIDCVCVRRLWPHKARYCIAQEPHFMLPICCFGKNSKKQDEKNACHDYDNAQFGKMLHGSKSGIRPHRMGAEEPQRMLTNKNSPTESSDLVETRYMMQRNSKNECEQAK